jgi:hypothetical protein
MADQEALEDILRQRESSHLRPEIWRSPEAMGDLLDDDFMEIGSSGTIYADKGKIIASLQDSTPIHASMSDFQAKLLGPGIALTTYRLIKQDREVAGEKHSLRSSIWKLMDGRWKLVFHQGTPTPS